MPAVVQHLQPSSFLGKSIFLALHPFLPLTPKYKLHLHSLPFFARKFLLIPCDCSRLPGKSQCLLIEAQKGQFGKAMNEDKSLYESLQENT